MASQDQIEALSRRLCEADGNPPDQMASLTMPAMKSVPGGIARFMPEPHEMQPCWQFYRHLAEEALK